MGLISKLGTLIEKQRIRAYESFLTAEKAKPEKNNIPMKQVEVKCQTKRQRFVFLTGGNVSQS